MITEVARKLWIDIFNKIEKTLSNVHLFEHVANPGSPVEAFISPFFSYLLRNCSQIDAKRISLVWWSACRHKARSPGSQWGMNHKRVAWCIRQRVRVFTFSQMCLYFWSYLRNQLWKMGIDCINHPNHHSVLLVAPKQPTHCIKLAAKGTSPFSFASFSPHLLVASPHYSIHLLLSLWSPKCQNIVWNHCIILYTAQIRYGRPKYRRWHR